jgi:hypothetical protein
VAYSIQVENMKDEEREKFDGDIGMTESAEEIARQDLARFQQEMGITFENPDAPVTVEPGMQDENYG